MLIYYYPRRFAGIRASFLLLASTIRSESWPLRFVKLDRFSRRSFCEFGRWDIVGENWDEANL